MSNNLKHPLPELVTVPSAALAQIINALNGPQYMILELLHTRRLPALAGIEPNPIDVLEERLLAYQRGEVQGQVLNASISVNVDEKFLAEVFEGVLENYRRIGGPAKCPVSGVDLKENE